MTETLSADDYNELTKQQKRQKYGNRRVEADGYTFDSKAEWRRYQELKLMLDAGEILALGVHGEFRLTLDGELICTYVDDFDYEDRDGELVVEDVKGVKTEAYIIKKKLMKAIYDIDIQEIEV